MKSSCHKICLLTFLMLIFGSAFEARADVDLTEPLQAKVAAAAAKVIDEMTPGAGYELDINISLSDSDRFSNSYLTQLGVEQIIQGMSFADALDLIDHVRLAVVFQEAPSQDAVDKLEVELTRTLVGDERVDLEFRFLDQSPVSISPNQPKEQMDAAPTTQVVSTPVAFAEEPKLTAPAPKPPLGPNQTSNNKRLLRVIFLFGLLVALGGGGIWAIFLLRGLERGPDVRSAPTLRMATPANKASQAIPSKRLQAQPTNHPGPSAALMTNLSHPINRDQHIVEMVLNSLSNEVFAEVLASLNEEQYCRALVIVHPERVRAHLNYAAEDSQPHYLRMLELLPLIATFEHRSDLDDQILELINMRRVVQFFDDLLSGQDELVAGDILKSLRDKSPKLYEQLAKRQREPEVAAERHISVDDDESAA